MEIVQFIFSTWWITFLGGFLFFTFLYFGGAFLGLLLKKKFKLAAISPYRNYSQQVKKEIKISLLSVTVFALEGIPVQWAYTQGYIHISEQASIWALCLQVSILFLWNELHFYLSHYLLHHRWFFKKVHYLHHQSTTPTEFSTYSFHWFEAVLLGSVIYLPMLLYPFHYLALLLLPVMSILLNVLGHWNHDLAAGKSSQHWLGFCHRHSLHHQKVRGNYGFFLQIFDKLFNTNLKNERA
ncbi:sterol desaturase family protein [Rapidithrix thailandica]|uniref:Sterol desaturase family protein n=1 Tax=Rapidithrix thailandica TaxID=413964 RepID=A0AAW9S125_9BACT